MARPKGSSGTRQLTEKQRDRIRTLYYDGNHSRAEIKSITGFTSSQIRHTIQSESAIVQPRSGRPRLMTLEQEEELIEFVCASKRNRRMGFLQLSMTLFDQAFGESVIRKCLYRYRFRRRISCRKPPISEKNRQDRLAWARDHLEWSIEQWKEILWTDETWVTGGPHRKQYVTRRQGEENDPTCITERHRKKRGWMF